MIWKDDWFGELDRRQRPKPIPGKTFEDWLTAELLKTWRHPGQPSYQKFLTERAQRHGIDVGGIIGNHLVKLAKREIAKSRALSKRHVPTVATIAQAPEQNGRGRARTHTECRISTCLADHHSWILQQLLPRASQRQVR